LDAVFGQLIAFNEIQFQIWGPQLRKVNAFPSILDRGWKQIRPSLKTSLKFLIWAALLRIEQIAAYWPLYRLQMRNLIQILTVEQETDGVVITYSDGTTAGYVVEELLELRPHREPTETTRSKK
jgi:hypothetical protein